MGGSTIGSKLTIGVTLGSTAAPGIYLSPLTITPIGYIAPSKYGVSGLSASISLGYVLNQGAISGGVGKQGGTVGDGDAGGGGVGLSGGSLTNDGTVTGGTGGAAGTGGGDGGHGGYGIDLAAAMLINSGNITGGDGGLGHYIIHRYNGGTGGTGAILASGILLNSGTISGGIGGAISGGDGFGTLGGAGGFGLILDAGNLVNQGLIIGGQPGNLFYNFGGGVGVAVHGGSLTNTGTISGKTSNGNAKGADGIVITGGNVVNRGTINGGDAGESFLGSGAPGGVGVTLAAGSLTNYGMISGSRAGTGHTHDGPGGAGVTISGGTLTNHGTIVGGTRFELRLDSSEAAGSGVDLSAGSLINDGTITGGYGAEGLGGVGVYFHNVGTLTNDGLISGGYGGPRLGGGGGGGVYFHNGGTLTNDGLISGGTIFSSYSINRATADAVDFGNGSSRLILGKDADFLGAVVANATYNNVLELTSGGGAGTVTNLGDTISGFQTVTIDPGAFWFVGGNTAGLAAGQTIDGFTVHDTIELSGIPATGSSYAGGILTLASAGGPVMLDLPGDFTTGDFIVNNAAAGVDITVVCFRAGTRIRVAGGDVPVEELCIGEPVLVLAPDGVLMPRPIVWIGHRSVDCRHQPNPHLVWPVRIRAGTFGDDVPCRDLFLSPDHAVFVDGALIPVKYLINGSSIEQVPTDEVTYFHIELQEHSVLLAEDLAAESYLDTGDRTKFSNGAKQATLFPDFATRMWEAVGCAPLVVTGATLDAVRRRINGGRQQRRLPTRAAPMCDPDKKPMHIWNASNWRSPGRSKPTRAQERPRAEVPAFAAMTVMKQSGMSGEL